MIALSTIRTEDWRVWRELRLEALREAPYAFASTLGEWQHRGDSESRWRERLRSVPFNVIARLGAEAAGMISGLPAAVPESVELISMWVAPFARGRGVGDALIGAVVSWAREQGAKRIELAVREQNTHAIALYTRNGFVDAGPIANVPGAPLERLMLLPV